MLGPSGSKLAKVSVNESGASIYSASDVARAEFPDLDLTVRGAISIARRLQDPLAELVKIDPKSIGVGQYQHDVNQTKLRKALDREVESCVNLVGVDLNTASVQLLSYVSGIGPKLAEAILATPQRRTALSPAGTTCSPCRGWGARRFSRARGSCGSAAAGSRWTTPPSIRKATTIVEKMAKAVGATAGSLIGDARWSKRSIRGSSWTNGPACPPSKTSSASWRSRAAIRATSSAWRSSPKGSTSWPTCARA